MVFLENKDWKTVTIFLNAECFAIYEMFFVIEKKNIQPLRHNRDARQLIFKRSSTNLDLEFSFS